MEPDAPAVFADRKRGPALVRAALGVLLVVALVRTLGAREIITALRRADPSWAALGVLWVVPQLLLLALRWQITGRVVGAPLRYREALREYALSQLVNQLLPLGVAGDAQRVWRHGLRMDAASAHSSVPPRHGFGPALRAALLDRASGQLVVFVWAALATPWWAGVIHISPFAAAVPFVLGLVAFWLALRGVFGVRVAAALALIARDAQALLSNPRAFGAQLALSIAVTASIALQLCCAARVLGYMLSFETLAYTVPFLLLSMALPLTAGGWGVREAASAALYRLSGLSVSEGVAVSLAFGALCVVASALGALLFCLRVPRRS